MSASSNADVRTAVREHYGKIAEQFNSAGSGCGCGCGTAPDNTARLYQDPDVKELSQEVTGLSLGCGDPITLAGLQPGQTVVDLGSGGGIDCFLAARKVGAEGRVIGVDMTSSMLEKARANREKIGADNVEFRLGEIENLPIPDNTADVVISNCVINLSPDKGQALREAFRVVKPGGRLAVSDMVTNGVLPEALLSSMEAWAGCVAGALTKDTYIGLLEDAGFVDIELTPDYFPPAAVDEAIAQMGLQAEARVFGETNVYEAVYSARISAFKPVEG